MGICLGACLSVCLLLITFTAFIVGACFFQNVGAIDCDKRLKRNYLHNTERQTY
jgi:hypothetical protein